MPASRLSIAVVLTAVVLAGSALSATTLAVPATAGAAQAKAKARSNLWGKQSNPVRVAAAVAARYWGAVPCNGQITVHTRGRVPEGVGSASDAWATFDSSLGRNNLAAPPSSYANCTIAFARSRWPTSSSMREDWDLFCATMTHELGHLLGHAHDVAHGSIMVPAFTDLASVPAICRDNRPPARSSRRR
jgi:hypothetical protein